MTTARMMKSLILATMLLAGGADAASNAITMETQAGKTVAQFTLGDSQCVLKDDRILCTPITK